MIEKFLTGISDLLIKGLSELNSVNSILFSVFLILLIVFGFVIRYIYKQNRSDQKIYAEDRKLSKEELISVYKDHSGKMEVLVSQVVTAVKDNTESNKAIVASVNNNNELIKSLQTTIILSKNQ